MARLAGTSEHRFPLRFERAVSPSNDSQPSRGSRSRQPCPTEPECWPSPHCSAVKIMQAAGFKTRFPESARVQSGLIVDTITSFEDVDGVFYEGVILRSQLNCSVQAFWIKHCLPPVKSGRYRIYVRACLCKGCTWRNRRAWGCALELILEEVWSRAVLPAPPESVAPTPGEGAVAGSIAARSEGAAPAGRADPAEGVASAERAAPARAAAAAVRQERFLDGAACEAIAGAAVCDLSGLIRDAAGALVKRREHKRNVATRVPQAINQTQTQQLSLAASQQTASHRATAQPADSQPSPNRPAR